MKLGKHAAAVEDCSSVLEHEAANVKALYRRGQALLAMGPAQLEAGAADLRRAAELEPGDKAIAAALTAAKKALASLQAKEKATYQRMFK
jgi:peptidyl-prolyl isomerase D